MEDLERQVEWGQLFVHDRLSKSFARLEETEAFLHALIDLLLAKGVVQEEELREALGQIRQEQLQRDERFGPGIAVRQEESAEMPAATVEVDCAARMHVCHAICCKLDFVLTISEIETGTVKWDLGRPYFIRQNEEGYCSHCQHETGHCQIYVNRPGVCRRYSCANDPRIWSNFEQMELNTAWIEEHLLPPRQIEGALVNHHMEPLPLIQVTHRSKKR